MSEKYVTVRNLDTGGVSKMRKSLAEHRVFGARLEIVPDGTKKKILIPQRFTEPAPELTPVEEVDDEDEEIELFIEKVKNG